MTARPTDDELRAMLEARAGAVSPGAAREALAGARAAIAGPTAEPGAGVAFDPRPVARSGADRGHRGGSPPWPRRPSSRSPSSAAGSSPTGRRRPLPR